MGNMHTNLDMSTVFNHVPVVDGKQITIKINLWPHAISEDKLDINNVILTAFIGNIKIGYDTDQTKIHETTYEWNPHSHMRDFEVIDAFGKDEVKIARGQGIGVIIIESLNLYIKLAYDKSKFSGILPVQVSPWNNEPTRKTVLSSDLGLGYDVLFITTTQVTQLCEALDERDTQKTNIFVEECNGLDKYQHELESDE